LAADFGRNDLQKPAEACCSEVGQALRLLEQKFGNSRMTGSGSAVFARVDGKESMSSQLTATLLEGIPSGCAGKICRSLEVHPLRGWAED